MKEQTLTWTQIENQVSCPLPKDKCRKDEGLTRNERMVSHNAIIFTSRCNFCERGVSMMGERIDNI